MANSANTVAKIITQNRCGKIQYRKVFTLSSGKLSHIYCDCRLINSNVEVRELILDYYLYLIQNLENIELIVGIETGGVAMGMLIADRLNLPFITSNYGENNFSGKRAVIIEDVINTGKTAFAVYDKMQSLGIEISMLICTLIYGKNLPSKYKVWTLCSIYELMTNDDSLSPNDRLMIEKSLFVDSIDYPIWGKPEVIDSETSSKYSIKSLDTI